jgi:hypothetical protein
MFLRRHSRVKDGKPHVYWSLVETVRTPDGPRQRTVCYLGELNGSAQARWLRTIEVFNEDGESRQLKLFPSSIAAPDDDSCIARVLVNQVRLERTRRFGDCFVGLELWKRLQLDGFWEGRLDRPEDPAEVRWSRVAAVLAINRLCAPGSELAIEERWFPSTALDDLLSIEPDKINDTRLYRCLDRPLPHKTKLERHLRERYGELFAADFDVLLYDLKEQLCRGRGGEESDDEAQLLARPPARLQATRHRTDRERRRVPAELRNFRGQPRLCNDVGGDRAHGGAQVWQSTPGLGV